MKSKLVLCLLSVCMFFACSSEDEEGPAFIEVTPMTSLVYEYQGGRDTISVNSSRAWKVSGETAWCSVQVISNANPSRVVVGVLPIAEKTDRSTTLTFVCGDQSVPVSVKQYGNMDTGYADLGLENPGVTVLFDKNTGVLTVDYAKDVPPVARQGQAIVLPVKYGYDIRVIESTKVEGKRLVAQTSQGNMGDLFRNTDFTLATDQSLGEGKVILPSEVGYLTPEGSYHELYNSSMSGRNVPDFFSYQKSFDKADLYNQNGNRCYWEKCMLEAKLKGAFYFKFGEKEENRRKQGDLEEFRMHVSGNLTSDYLLKYDFKQTAGENMDKVVQQNFAQSYIFRFVVNSVPVIIVTRAHLNKIAELQVTSSLSATIGFKDNGMLDVKTEWRKGGEETHTYTYTPSLEVVSPKRQVTGTFTGRTAYYPCFEFELYRYPGVWMKPTVCLKEKVTSVSQVYGKTYYAWNAETGSEVDFSMGGDFDFAGKDNAGWATEICRLKDDLLLEAPRKIELLSPEDSIQVTRNKNIEAQFKVTSYCPLTGKYEPCAGALVVFEAENGLSSQAVVSDAGGIASVSWKPGTTGKQARLKAGIAGQDNAYVDEVSLDIFFKETSTPGEPVDLGLSVKWSSWNLGASAPEGFGDCFAWGEIEEKAEYTWKSYAFAEDANEDGDFTPDEVENFGDIEGTGRDIAHVQWGGNWRMPTVGEVKELLDKCTWEWTSQNGVNGRKVTGPNGNSIFLPATGYRDEGGLKVQNVQGYYWTGSLYTEMSTHNKACRLYFCQAMWRWEATWRYWGGFIRPVIK